MTNTDPKHRSETGTPTHTDIAIVGAGMVGGALACALANNGIKSVIIDRLEPSSMVAPKFDGRASAIALSSQRLLKMIGVWRHLDEHAGPIKEIRVSDGESLFFLHFDHGEVGSEPLGFMLENRFLRAAIAKEMRRHKKNLSVIAPATIERITTGVDSIALTLCDGREITAQLVVSAEGRKSTLREWADIRVTGWQYDQTAIVATISHEHSHECIAHERFLSAGPFAILPLPDEHGMHRSSLVWTGRADTAAAFMTLSDDAFLMEIAERIGGFLGEIKLLGPRFSHPLGLQFASRYCAGRLALVGDAAHSIHPIAGQGLNLGLRDVAALTESIVESGQLGLDFAHPEGLSRYEQWRRSDNLLMATVTDGLNRLFSNDVAPIRMARDVGLAAVNRIPPLKRMFMRHAMGTVGDLPRLMREEPLS